MKSSLYLIIFSFMFCFSHFLYSLQDLHATTLGVIIMIKDEVDVIEPTLEPFIKAGVETFLVYDTGSTDGTQEKVRTYFENNNIQHGYIIEEPFIDFATSRNRLITLAEELFPHVTFFVMLDAEWYIHNAAELLLFCEQHEHMTDQTKDGSCYTMRLITVQDNMDNYVVRLIRNGHNVRYEGVVHESIKTRSSGCVPSSVYFEYLPKECGREKSCKRWERDYHLLKKSLVENPTDGRTLFYLAQTCQFLEKWEEAIMYYSKRAALNDISEECFVALYRIGCAIEYILYNPQAPKTRNTYSWNDALYYYFEAYSMLPHRAEPLVRIATYYLYCKQYALAYLFARRAVELPYPTDVLFVEKQVYNFTRYDILGQCAFYMGEYEEGKNAILNAIKSNPDAHHLYHNLALYLQNIII